MPILLLMIGLLVATCSEAIGQERRASSRPFEIADNSFLVEEAFNQPAGIFQNIFVFRREQGSWSAEFTQEWPVGSERHQLSYTVPLEDWRHLGNIAVNYRLQARSEDKHGVAVSPRLSLVLPTGDNYDWGAQVNLPVSRQFGDLYVHANGGASFDAVDHPGTQAKLLSPHAALGLIYRSLPMVHLMLETVWRNEERLVGVPGSIDSVRKEREPSMVVSPGARFGWNLGTHQLVLGVAAPVDLTAEHTSLLLYLSYELPFRTAR